MIEQHKHWWMNLPPTEKTRLGLKYRNTLAYGIFKDEVILEIYNKEQMQEDLDCPYDFTSRCTMGRCDCKTKVSKDVETPEKISGKKLQ